MQNKYLICPICHTALSLSENGRSLLCERATKPHCFDISSAGYVNLDRGHAGGGDSKDCVKHRSAFLDRGHYAPISERLCSLAEKYTNNKDSLILDAGCGEGYYTLALAKKLPLSDIIGIDISKSAAEHGAKAAKREHIQNLFYAVCSIFELPLSPLSVSCITNIFAPCPEDEFHRVLRNGGTLIIAAAGEKHLLGLKKALYDEVYMNETRADLPSGKGFELVERSTLSYSISLTSGEEIEDLFAMTPYYYRTSLSDKEKLSALKGLETEVEIDFSVYRKNG